MVTAVIRVPKMEELKEKRKNADMLEERYMLKTESATSKGTSTMDHVMTKRQIIKNLVLVSLAFLFLFTAFASLQNLQSSLNREEGLGTVGLAIIYAAGVVAGIFLPTFVIGHLGCKWTIAVSMVCYILYMAANFHAVWGTMVPASLIIGTGAATLWAAKCTYLTQMADWYAKLTNATTDDIVNRFFGFFFMTFQTCQVWGNLISSTVFSQKKENETVDVSENILSKCGPNYCPTSDVNNTNLERPDIEKIYTVCGIYLASAILGLLIVVCLLDRIILDKDLDKSNKEEGKISFRLLTVISKHWWDSRYQKLLVPLTVYSGVEQAFIWGDFTRSYVSCAIGIWNVGYVMIAFGVSDAICSFTFGRLVQLVGHIPFFILALLVHGGIQIALLFWIPTEEETIVFYVIALLWGMGDAVIQTQINAFYGYLFTEKPEAAFASYRICENMGFIIAFGYSSFLCTDIKLYVCLAFLVVGMILYGVVEVLHRRNIKQTVSAES